MRLIHVDEIQIPPERIRKEFTPDALRSLRESIEVSGLFHPLLLRADARTLVAGERRLRVLREFAFDQRRVLFGSAELPLGVVPCVVMGEADEMGYLETEFTENTRRAQLTWQEEAEYLHRYHVLAKEKDADHRKLDTVRELEVPSQSTHQALLVAPYLHLEAVRSAKTLPEGLKQLERHLETEHRRAVAKQLGTLSQTEMHTLRHGDLRQILPGLQPNRFDLLIADPPYGVNAHKWYNMSAVEHTYLDTPEYSDEIYRTIVAEGTRLTKPAAHAYLFCELGRFPVVSAILNSSGWRVWPWPLIYWRGATNGICPWPEHGPRRTFECIVFAIKGDRRINGIFPDVLHYPDDGTVERGAHKPAALYADLLGRSISPGGEVLDPCVGTGSIFDAAKQQRVRCFGIEIEAAAYAQARERLK